MSWSSLHGQSEALAAAAHEAVRDGHPDRAKQLFDGAARAEQQALDAVSPDRPRTLGITAISAVALWYKAGELEQAAELAHRASTMSGMPGFALDDLRGLLQTIWNEQARKEADLTFVPGQVVVSVKGGEVVAGGAPLDLIVEKVQIVQSLFYRTAEYLKSLPLRKRGPPPKDIQERCRPWLFQSVPGSYQFAVAIQKPEQGELFATGDPEPEVLTDTFLSVLRAAVEDPTNALSAVVASEDYRQTFMKLTRNLAPTGKSFNELEIRRGGERPSVLLVPSSRKLITDTLRTTRVRAVGESPAQEIQGTLRAVHLDQDWLEISVAGVHTRVTGVAEAVDDLIVPMVNREVIVRVRPGPRNSFLFIDIELKE
jgi:hypothetical protein